MQTLQTKSINSEKAKIAETMLVISCSDYQAVRSNTVSYWLEQARNIKSFGNTIPAFKEKDSNAHFFETMILSSNIKDIVILGHTGCCAIKSILAEPFDADERNLSAKTITHEKYSHLSEQTQAEVLVKENALMQIEMLLSYPKIKQAIQDGKIQVHAWVFEHETGKYHIYDAQTWQYVDAS